MSLRREPMSPASRDRRAFAGVRVLDLTRVLAGPYCTYQLALLGAEVIKIERPGRGETIRWRTESDPAYGARGMSLGFSTQSANKRFMTLDVGTLDGAAVYLELAKRADVVVQNLRTGSAERHGIGYEEIKAVNEPVVFCAITAYGATGPKRADPAYDSVIQAWSGFMSTTGTAATGPLKAGPPIVDYATGMAAAYAISAALYQRAHTGEGQFIDISMLDVNVMLMASVATALVNTGNPPKPAGNDASSRAPVSTTYATADGLLAIACNEEHQYQHLLKVLDLGALDQDARFAQPAGRREHIAELRAAVQAVLATRPALEWERAFNAAGVPAGRVRSLTESMSDPQIAARELFHTFAPEDTLVGKPLRVPLSPFRFAHNGPRADVPPKAAGADTDAILQELGYDALAIARLKANGVV